MFSKIMSATLSGIDACMVHIETDISVGLPSFEMVGTLGQEVKEAKDRILVALKNSGIGIKPAKIVVNISPADLRKGGTGFDLPMAVGILIAGGYVETDFASDSVFIGELSLDGRINPVKGALPVACLARSQRISRLIVPYDNYYEALAACDDDALTVYGVRDLKDVIMLLGGEVGDILHTNHFTESFDLIEDLKSGVQETGDLVVKEHKDYKDVKGQYAAKRATMIAAAGMHNLMYIGPPGCGKTMLAERIPSIMPEMSFEERLEVTKILSVAGLLNNSGMIKQRPFRQPHHNITMAGLLGGGRFPKPGEVTLSAKGVLFLDEMTEFRQECLESLRQPLEDRSITISRQSQVCTFPADFMLVGAINPCKCGYYPDRNRCKCQESEIRRYFGKISNPLLDRFDICVMVDSISQDELIGSDFHKEKESADDKLSSDDMRKLIKKARLIQMERFCDTGINYNSEIGPKEIEHFCALGRKEKEYMRKVYTRLGLTARGYNKIIKTARTIADIEGCESISVDHLGEACMYRNSLRP